MIQTLEQIQTRLGESPAPGELADLRVLLSHKYAAATDRLEACEHLFNDYFAERREDHKSDASTERAWYRTNSGQEHRHWELQLKKIKQMSNAISSVIKVRSDEAHNQY